jgi:hypothetical protein
VNGHLVLQCDYSQDTIVKFRYGSPKTKPILLLGLTPNRIFQDLNAPFLFQIGTFPQDLVLEVVGEFVRLHIMELSGSQLAWKGVI